MLGILEGILFLRGDEGISREEVKEILAIDETQLNDLITELKTNCQNKERGIILEEYGNILKFVTKKEHEEIFKKMVHNEVEKPLTEAALEVLAIIAYNQPITRLEIDELRGVASTHLLRRLVLKELIYEADRSDAPGRPILYRTTAKFLDSLGLKDLSHLPPISEFAEREEIDLFSRKINESD